MVEFTTPDPNLGTSGAKTTPPSPPRKGDASKQPEEEGIAKDLAHTLSEAASSSKSDTVVREQTLAELMSQVAFLQSEIIRRQTGAPCKQPVSSVKKPVKENPVQEVPVQEAPKANPPHEKTPLKQPHVSVLAPEQNPLAPRIDLITTEITKPPPKSSSRHTPSVRNRTEPTYEEDEADSDYPPPKRTQREEMRTMILKEMAAAKQADNKEDSSEDHLSPLASSILNVRFPKKFVAPVFKCYDGTTDPLQHLRNFQDRTAVYSYDDALICRMFPSSLEGKASDWFYSLKPESLHNYKQIAQIFKAQYSSCREYKKNRNHLFTLKMAEDETLKSYITRFQAERASIYSCSDDVAAVAFISGLHVDHKFYSVIVKEDITEMKDIFRLAPGYIQLEEVRRSKKFTKEAEKSKADSSKAPGGKGNIDSNANRGGKKPAYTNNADSLADLAS